MRIGIDITAAVGPFVSGVGYHIIRLVEAMDARTERGTSFDLFFECTSLGAFRRARQRFASCRHATLRPIPFVDTKYATVRRLYTGLLVPLYARLTRCDVFHGPAHLLPPGLGMPTVVTIHDLAFFRFELYAPEFTQALRRGVTLSVEQASIVIALSENTRRELQELLGRTDGVRVVYGAGNYATSDDRTPAPTDRGTLAAWGVRKPYVFYVGDFGRRKNLPYLIDGFAALRAGGADVQLVLAGNSAAARADLLAHAATHGLSEADVILPGRVSDAELKVLYRNASAFALCSLMEGFTLVTLEAMSYGVPLVATATSSIAEGTGDAAELVPLDAPDAVGKALMRAITPGPRRDEMRSRGFERVARFSWEAAAEQTLAVYQDAMRVVTGR